MVILQTALHSSSGVDILGYDLPAKPWGQIRYSAYNQFKSAQGCLMINTHLRRSELNLGAMNLDLFGISFKKITNAEGIMVLVV